MTTTLGSALAEGRLPNQQAVLSVVASRVEDNGGESMRAMDVRAWRGVDLRLLPDRGLDIGPAWYGGQPLAWVSAVGETVPRAGLEGIAWSGAFGGGLLVTCGLRNVGMPSEGHGLHGTFSHLPAHDVEVVRNLDVETPMVTVTGTIEDPAEPPLKVNRAITTYLGVGRVEITDRATNTGALPTVAPVLYHFNFGYPLWGPGATLSMKVTKTIPRDPDSVAAVDSWGSPPEVTDAPERVLEHVVVDDYGWCEATIENDDLDVALTVRWRTAELPRLHQWLDPSPGMYVLGIEPANCSTMGRSHDRAEGRLPVLEPGEVRETALVVEVA